MVGPACRSLQILTKVSQELLQLGPTRTAMGTVVTSAFGIGGHSLALHSKGSIHHFSPLPARRTYSSAASELHNASESRARSVNCGCKRTQRWVRGYRPERYQGKNRSE